MRILVSCCLLGIPTRYDGKSKKVEWVTELASNHTLIPICPEQLGGMSTPRSPSECRGSRVISASGLDVTLQYEAGAAAAAKIARITGADVAILKARSPSCGCGSRYDGTFSGTLVEKSGVTAEKLLSEGMTVFTENQEQECREWIAAHS